MGAGKTETRKAILEAARRLMERDGASEARLEDIARAAKVSRQAVYLHFGSRSGLLLALAQHVNESERILDHLEATAAAPDAVAALDRFARFRARYLPKVDAIARALDVARDADPAAEQTWRAQADGFRELCKGLVVRLQREGVLADSWTVDEATDALWAITSVGTYHAVTRDLELSPAQYLARIKKTLRATFLTDAARRRAPNKSRSRGGS